MTILEKIRRTLNDEFRNALAADFEKKFGLEVESEFAFLSDRLVTTRCDKKKFTIEQKAWIETYEKGYLAAMHLVYQA